MLLKVSLPQKQTQKLAIRKPKLLRSNPYRLSVIKLQGVHPSEVLVDDEELFVSRERYRVVAPVKKNQDTDDNELSDYVKVRLLVARTRAMAKFAEVQAIKEKGA
jgi:hypothetical protein